MAGCRRTIGIALLMLLVSGGCRQMLQQYFPHTAPPVLPPQPTFVEVSSVVNRNRDVIHSLYASDATISVPLAPALRCELSMERPKRFRLRASTSLTGPEVDLGSNDERFWLWVRLAQPAATFTCRHDQFQTSAARQVLPIEPEWLLDAFGMTGFDPGLEHSEPIPVRGGKVEIRTSLPTAQGTLTKITVVDVARGWVVEQHVYDATGQRLASALASDYWRDPGSGAMVPKRIEIQWPATHFQLTIHVKTWMVNSLPADPSQLWTMPEFPGYPVVDLGSQRMPVELGLPAEPVAQPQALRPSMPIGNGLPTWR